MQETTEETTEETMPGGDVEPTRPDALTAKQELALSALLSHPTLKEAALAAGVSEATLWRYNKDEAFARRLREARRDVFAQTITPLQRAMGDAVRALHDIVCDPEASGAVRVSAARAIMDQSRRALEIDDLRAGLDEMERFILRKQEEDALRSAKGEEG